MRLKEYIAEYANNVYVIKSRRGWTTNEQLYIDVKRMITRDFRLRRMIESIELVEGLRIRVAASTPVAEKFLAHAINTTEIMLFPDDDRVKMSSIAGVGYVDDELSIVFLRAGASKIKGKTSVSKTNF